ncbi:MAG: glycosyltransferase family 4 protein [Bacteroidales bacterium]|nr:glycosyltransferase family 4 protein [Bacteroidales bacterium]
MKRLLIIETVWSPYSHARFTAIAKHIGEMELTVFFQNSDVKYRKWDTEIADSSYKMIFLKNIGIPISANTAFVCNINYNIYQEIKKYNPDRIIATGWDSFATLAAIVYAKMHGKEIILWTESTIHEDSFIRKISMLYVRFILRFFNGFISAGTAAEEYLRFLGGRKRIERFYNSVDADFFSTHGRLTSGEKRHVRERIGIGHDSKVIMFSGRLVAIKCPDLLIKAFFIVKREFPKMELLVVGYGPEEQKLKKMAGVNSGIHFLGHQGIDEIPKLYGISDILVLPSISEPWGLVVNEAMACGCAIIVSDKCGCAKDLIQGNGIIVESGSLDSLIEALKEVLSSEERLNQLKQESLKVIQHFRPETLVKTISFFQN